MLGLCACLYARPLCARHAADRASTAGVCVVQGEGDAGHARVPLVDNDRQAAGQGAHAARAAAPVRAGQPLELPARPVRAWLPRLVVAPAPSAGVRAEGRSATDSVHNRQAHHAAPGSHPH